jgi:ABC-type amino acid transport substrate-binding protein
MKRKGLFEAATIFGLIICLFFCVWGGSFAAAQEESALQRIKRTGVIRVGWALFFPWMRLDEKTNKVVGMSADLYEELARALGNVKIEWVADNWVTIPSGLQANKFDIICPLGITFERAMVVDYTEPLMREAILFLIKKKDATRFKTMEDIDKPGVKVSTTLGTNSDLYLTRLFKKPEIIRFKSVPEGLMAMTLGKADAWASVGSSMVDALKLHPETTVIKGHYGVGKNCMAIKQGDQIFLNWLNLFISDMKETGTLDRIFQKYGSKGEIFFD